MKDVMGIIYTGENDARLRELTIIRAIAALPVAGRFRVIDFLVSSMVNGGMINIGVIMQKNYHSLMDHLGSGKEWDLHGKHEGLHILPPFLTRENVGLYPGILDALRSNNSYLTRSKQETLVLSGSDIIYNARLEEILRFHQDSGAAVTPRREDVLQLGDSGENISQIQQRLNALGFFDHEITGDAFAPRNPYALEIDFKQEPPEFGISKTHFVRSWLADPRAPKVSMPETLARRIESMKKEAANYAKS